MRTLIPATMCLLALTVGALAQSSDPQTKAQQILLQARAAIASEAQLKSLQTLSVLYTSSRTIGAAYFESDIEYDILLPDKFRRRESRQPFTTVTVMQDENALTYSVPNPASGGDAFRENSPAPQAQARRRADFTRVLLSLLLRTPSEKALEYRYAGEHNEPDGTAEMVDVKGEDGFAARLYIDQKTHRLVALSYRAKQLSHAVRAMARLAINTPPQRPTQAPKKLTPEEQAQLQVERWAEVEKRRKQFEEALENSPEVEYRWTFGEFKSVKGFTLPHHLTKAEANYEYEEWNISSYKINPKFPPTVFGAK